MPEDDCFIEGIAGVEMVQLAAQLTGYPPSLSSRKHEVLDFCGTGQGDIDGGNILYRMPETEVRTSNRSFTAIDSGRTNQWTRP